MRFRLATSLARRAAGACLALLLATIASSESRAHHLLSANELKCSTLIYRGGQRVSFLERHGNGCPGEPGTGPRRFDIEVDLRGGTAYWDGSSADMSMQPLPRLLPEKPQGADER